MKSNHDRGGQEARTGGTTPPQDQKVLGLQFKAVKEGGGVGSRNGGGRN